MMPQQLAEKIEEMAWDFSPVPGEVYRHHFNKGAEALYSLLAPEIENLVGALESARGWVSTHAMQTYSSVAAKEVKEIDDLLTRWREFLGEKNQGDE